MSLAWTLRTKKFGNFTYLQWLVILIIFVGVIMAIGWFMAESAKPQPEIFEGYAEGAFHGRQKFFSSEGATERDRATSCYMNNSYLYFFNGNITYNDGTIEVVGEEGRKISGRICLITVDSYIWSSDDKYMRTPIHFSFSGTITPMPIIDPTPLIPWGIIGLLLLIIAYLVYRKVRLEFFDAMVAERVFSEYVQAKGLRTIGPIESERQEVMGGKQYTVAQPIEWNRAMAYLVMDIDNRKTILSNRVDDTGDVYRAKMGKEAQRFNMEMRKSINKFSEEDVAQQATMRIEEYFRKKDTGRLAPNTAGSKRYANRVMPKEPAPFRITDIETEEDED
jgi:hypothetical protein